MTTRRNFLGTLGRALGAGGLLLPWSGKGALALPADLGEAAQLPLTAAPLPFSVDALKLREIKRALHELRVNEDRRVQRWRAADPPNYGEYSAKWMLIKWDEYNPLQRQLAARPVQSWTDCVELAEAIWAFWPKEDGEAGPTTARLSVSRRYCSISADQLALIVALVEGVLALGGGERFDPTIVEVDAA